MRFPYKKKYSGRIPIHFPWVSGQKVFWIPRAPSIGGTILRKGHLVQVRRTFFKICFADLRFADQKADVPQSI